MGMGRLICWFCFISFILLFSSDVTAQDSVSIKNLPSIRITDRKRNFIERNDTIIYDAKAFMNKEVHKVKDLLSSMPGFTIDKTGRVMFNGKEVKQVMINGENLTGNSYEIITKNLQAGLISKVELVKRFHENRLLSGVEWGDEQAINLVVEKQRQYKVNAQQTIGLTYAFKRKEFDGNIISLYKKSSSLVVYDINNHGRKPNGLDASNLLQANEIMLFTLPSDGDMTYVSIDIPDNYFRNNNGKAFNLNHSYKITPHLSIKTHITSSSEKIAQEQHSVLAYHFPGTDHWKNESRGFNKNELNTLQSGLEIKYDNEKRHISSYGFQIGRSRALQSHLKYIHLPMDDTTKSFIANNRQVVSCWGNESFRVSKKCILVTDVTYVTSIQNTQLDLTSKILKFLPDELTESSQLLNHANAHESILSGVTKLVCKAQKRFFQIGLNVMDQHVSTVNNIMAYTSINSMYNAFSNAAYQMQKRAIYVKCDQEISKKLLLSWQSSIGYSSVQWRQSRRSGFTGYASTSLNYRNKGFRQTSLLMSVSKGLPNKNMYHASPMFNEQIQLMYGPKQISFPVKAHIQLFKTYTDLYKGISLTSNLSMDRSYHGFASILYQYQLYSIAGYQLGKGVSSISGAVKFQKNIFSLMIKPFIDVQYSKMQQAMFLNADDFHMYSDVSETQFGLVSYWNTILNVETSIGCRSVLTRLKPVKEDMKTIDQCGKVDLKIKCDISKNTYATFYGMMIWNKLSTSSFTCLDAYLEHRLSTRTLIMLRMHNLLNQGYYIERRSSSYLTQEMQTGTIPRYLLLSVQFEL